MDNNCLFVCFSHEARAVPKGRPPFHDEIKAFAASMNEASFAEFYEGRFKWHWYPIITRGVSSFPTHGDLPEELSESELLEAIGYAANICSKEDGKRFISALGLLSLLCRSVDSPEAVPSLTTHFMAIRQRVTENAIDANIHYWFSMVALYQLSSGVAPDGYEGSFDHAGLNAPEVDAD